MSPPRPPRAEDVRGRLRSALPPLALVCVLLGAWEVYADAGSTSAFVLPAPHAVAAAINSDPEVFPELRPRPNPIGLMVDHTFVYTGAVRRIRENFRA